MRRFILAFTFILFGTCVSIFGQVDNLQVTDFQLRENVTSAIKLLDNHQAKFIKREVDSDLNQGVTLSYECKLQGYKKVNLSLMVDNDDILRSVIVDIPAKENWQQIKSIYDRCKTVFIEYFGEQNPFTVENFAATAITDQQKVESLGKGTSIVSVMFTKDGNTLFMAAGKSNVFIRYADIDWTTMRYEKRSQSYIDEYDEEKVGHLKFKGLPINGSLDTYVEKLVDYGMTLISKRGMIAELIGEFAGVMDCKIVVASSGIDKTVYKVAAFFPVDDNWEDLINNYKIFQSRLQRKYGEPVYEESNFKNKECLDDDSKIQSLRLGNCNYFSVYEADNGDVELGLFYDKIEGPRVRFLYTDKINEWKKQKNAMDEL